MNTPGFAARGRSDDQGNPIALVASIGPAATTEAGGTPSLADIKTAVREAMVEQATLSAFTAKRDEMLARSLAVTRPLSPRERIAQLLASAATPNTVTDPDGDGDNDTTDDPMDNSNADKEPAHTGYGPGGNGGTMPVKKKKMMPGMADK